MFLSSITVTTATRTSALEIHLVVTSCPEERYGEKIDAREDGRQAKKWQASNDLVPGFERMD